MKKILLLLILTLSVNTFAQTNLINNWQAGTLVGTGSSPVNVGWNCQPMGTLGWNTANLVGGSRFVDYNVTNGYTGYTDFAGNDSIYKQRLMYIRWDAGNTSSYYTLPVQLEANKRYRFSWKYAWNSNATAPILTAGIVTSNNGYTGSVTSKAFACSATAKKLLSGNMEFNIASAGQYYLSIKSTTASLCGISDLSIIEIPYVAETDSIETLTADGAWCWFNDPRAIYYKGFKEQTYFGWVTQQGHIVIASYNHQSGEYIEKIVHANYEADDHDNPAIFIRKDGHIIIYYSKHTTAPAHRLISTNPEDITSFGDDYQFGVNVTYPYPFQVGDSIFTFYRGINWHPTLIISNDNGLTQGTPVQLITGGGARPYTRYYQDNTGAIHIASTHGHPRDVWNNKIYYVKFYQGKFYKADGTFIKDFGWGINPLNVDAGEAELVYDGTSYGKGWIWDITVDSLNRPVMVYASFPTDTDHRYHYARWNGTSWFRKQLTNAGKWFPQTPAGSSEPEPNYSGGIILNPNNPDEIYLSKQVNNVFEIMKFTTPDNGATWDSVAITSNTSPEYVNVRPVVPRNHPKGFFDVLWMRGQYVYYGNGKYYTSIVYKTNSQTKTIAATTNGGNGNDALDGANFASFNQNSIMTFNGYQYICYWNSARQVALSRRKLPDGPWQEISLTDYTTTDVHINDNHYNISMGICANDGTIHLAFDHHGDVLHYRKSIPGLATQPETVAWSAASFQSTQNYLVAGNTVNAVTYPRFIQKPNGDLLYECRLGTSGNGDDYLWEYTASNGLWTSLGQYLNGTSVNENAYINGIQYDKTGKLHVSWVWRQTPDAQTNHDIHYIYSDDDGRTWKNNAGTVIGTVGTSPVVMSSAGIRIMTIPTNRALINQESQAVDNKGKIHILNSFLPDGVSNTGFWDSRINKAVLYHIYQNENGIWQKDSITKSTRNRSQIAVDSLNNLYVVAAGYRVYYAKSSERWKTWYPMDVSQVNTIYNEGLIDRENLLQNHTLSFVFAKAGGEIIVPSYTLGSLSSSKGEGLSSTTTDGITTQSGYIEFPSSANYTLYFTASGNSELYINGVLKIRTVNDATPRTHWVNLNGITATGCNIVIRSNQPTTLEWSNPQMPRTTVPAAASFGTAVTIPEALTITPEGYYALISPNPTTTEFVIQTSGVFKYAVFSQDGTLIESDMSTEFCKIGASYTPGDYILQLTKNDLSAQAILKKRQNQ